MRKLLKTVMPVLLPFFFMAVSVDKFSEVVFQKLPEHSLHNIDIKTEANGDRAYTVSDTTYSKNMPVFDTDLLLTFNGNSDNLNRDDTSKYSVAYCEYYPYNKNDSLGGGCAMFFKSNHGIKITTVPGLWLGQSSDLGSFTVEFRFRLKNRAGDGIIFSRLSSLFGIKKGIEIRAVNGSLYSKLHNMFKKSDGSWTGSSNIFTKVPLLDKWYHYGLSFDRMTGKLTVTMNGKEVHAEYMTGTGNPGEDVYVPYFSHEDSPGSGHYMADMPLVKIGINYTGCIDELRISQLSMERLKSVGSINVSPYKSTEMSGRIPFNHEGVITSPVYSFETTGSMVDSLNWEARMPDKTFIWAEFRIADRYFDRNDSSLKWYRVKNGQRGIFMKKDPSGLFLRGKYYQWRLHLVSSPDGTEAPVFKKLSVSYRTDTAPVVPMFTEIVKAGSGKVIIRWKKNVDYDIAGYRIYYGTREGVYDGIISAINGRAIDNSMAKGTYIEVELDNSVIDENRKIDSRGVLKYPLLRDTVLYFFSVAAYDSYRVGTVYNHESKLSKPVTARPYGGSEIN